MRKIDRENVEDILSLTPMQEGMLFHYLKEPGSSQYFEQLSLEVSGTVDIRLFEAAWHVVIETNEMLRTVFRWEDIEKPVQIVLKEHHIQPGYYDFSGKEQGEKKKRLEEIKDKDRKMTFDLLDVPFRVTLCKIEKNKYEIIISNHHILYDGWSNGIILKEFFEAYDQLCKRGTSNLTLPIKTKTKFKEFIKKNQAQDIEKQGKFWKEYLKGYDKKSVSPVKRRKRKKIESTANYRVKFTDQMKKQLKSFVRKNKITLSSLLYSAWGILLQKFNSCNYVLFDTTVSGRSAKVEGIESMVGLFINTLPFLVNTGTDEKIKEFLSRLHQERQTREEFENTFDLSIKEYFEEKKQDLYFDSVLIIENYPLARHLIQENSQLSVKSFSISGQTNYDLTLIITMFDDIELCFTYDNELFNASTLDKLFHYFRYILEYFIENPEKQVTDISFAEETIEIPDAQALVGEGPSGGVQPDAGAFTLPRSDVEKKLAQVWAETLKLDKSSIGIDDNFFDFGGHSLKASLLISKIHKVLDVKIPLAQVFKTPSIRELAEYIHTSARKMHDTLESAEEKEYYPLSSAQNRLYMLQQMEPGNIAYNGPFLVTLQGKPDKERMENIEKSFENLIKRHESLRTSFEMIEGEPVQRIHDHVEFKIERLPVTINKSNYGTLPKYSCSIQHSFVRPFDLARAPLLRVGLMKIGREKHLLVVDMHHIITDGTARDIFIREFMALYKGEALPEVRHPYKDFSRWQNHRLAAGQLKSQQAYWLNVFCGEPPVLNMPLDYPRPRVQQFEGAHFSFSIGKEPGSQLSALVRETGTTLYIFLLALFNILMGKYTGQDDIVIGSAVAGRSHSDLEYIMGLLMETIAIRNYPGPDKPFSVFLKEVKHHTLEVFWNQDYPFRELIKQVGDASNPGRNPLFDFMLIVQNLENTELELEGFTITPFFYETGISKVDLTLEAVETVEGIDFTLEYCTRLFKRETIERFAAHFVNLIWEVIRKKDNLSLKLSGLQILSEGEKYQLLEEFNAAAEEFPGDKLIHQLFTEQVKRTTDHTALVGKNPKSEIRNPKQKVPSGQIHAFGENISITYKELNEKSDQLAYLLKENGVCPGTIVAIMVERSVEMVIGILGILKAGGAYLPIEPGYPEGRINYMLTDAKVKFLLAAPGTRVKVKAEVKEGRRQPRGLSFRFIDLEDIPSTSTLSQGSPANPAYIIYTSGTTGRPKGVIVEHQNLLAYLNAFNKEFRVKPGDIVIQQASYAFDVFVEEVYPALLKGACIAIAGKETLKDIDLFCDFISRIGGTIIDCSPLLLGELNKRGPIDSIHTYISGGDVLEAGHIDNLLKRGSIYNTYGPTESTVCAAYYRCSGDNPRGIPIGKPIVNYKVYILDQSSNLLPIGVCGQLCISGAGVTRGYLNQPELTAEKFRRTVIGHVSLVISSLSNSLKTNDKFSKGSNDRLYRTGDLARWLPDSNIEFMGRIDHQVKIRGYRIELGEIETQLLRHKDIKETVVMNREDNSGKKYLCAYVVPHYSHTTHSLDTAELKSYLRGKLPDYMIPAWFVPLERIPLTHNKKVDRKLLPEPDRNIPGLGVAYAAPTNEIEQRLVELWEEILSLDQIGIHDNFFDLGGDSISANQSIARIREEFQVELPLRYLFEKPSILELAREVNRREKKLMRIKEFPRKGKIPLSFAQERLWFLHHLDAENKAYHVPRTVRVKGKLDVNMLERTFTRITQRHEILRTLFPVIDGEPVQSIREPAAFKIPILDLTGWEEPRQSKKVSQWLLEEGQRGFDFEKGPMMRVTLVKLKKDESLLVLTEHHLIHDGWTQGVLLKEFITVFTAYWEGKEPQLLELPIQYADFALSQRHYFQGEVLEQHLDYWRKKLAGLPPFLGLPTDHPRPSVISGRGDMKELVIAGALSRGLAQFSLEKGSTLFMTMLAVFKVLLFRYTGVEDLCVGIGAANRKYKELEGMLGMVINTLALRTQIEGEDSFDQCLQKVKNTCLEAYKYEDTPFDKVVDAVQPERSLSYTPIFQVMFNFMDVPAEEFILPGLELHVESTHNRSSKFDMNLVVVPPRGQRIGLQGDEILVEWEYNTDIFEPDTIDRMLTHYTILLEAIIHHSQEYVSALPILSDSEKKQLLSFCSGPRTDYPVNKTIHRLFEEQAERTPESTALVGSRHSSLAVGKKENMHLTYDQLNRTSYQLAHLLQENGANPDTIVGIMVERSIEMIIGIFGILKSGGAYLPIDPEYPEKRINYMLADSNARLFIRKSPISGGAPLCKSEIDTGDLNKIGAVSVLNFEHLDFEFLIGRPCPGRSNSRLPASDLSASNLAYVIYTSGSTGSPKGVMIEHHSVVNRLNWMQGFYPIGEADVILQKTPVGFDVSVWELFWWGIQGASLCLLGPGEEKNPTAILETISRSKVTTMHFVPSMLNAFLEYLETPAFTGVSKLASLKQVFASGEALLTHHVERFNNLLNRVNGTRLINLYGPTEGTVDVSYYNCLPDEDYEKIPIGKPIDNINLYVVNKGFNLQPRGIPGELCISGVGLARGYLNRPGLTAEKFVRTVNGHWSLVIGSPHSSLKTNARSPHYPITPLPQSPIYFTGDLARWLPDGNIEFLGRKDTQVKIRGFRIELEEIEKCLLNHDAINEAVVTLQTLRTTDIDANGAHRLDKKYLCAYIVPVSGEKIDIMELRKGISMQLPQYMIPAYFVRMKTLPITPNGKVDRRSLPGPETFGLKLETAGTNEKPATHMEKIIAETWKETLKLGKVGVVDNFFHVGGNSLEIARLANKLKQALNKDIEFETLFRYPTIRALAKYLTSDESEESLQLKNKNEGTVRTHEIKEGKRRLRQRIKNRDKHRA